MVTRSDLIAHARRARENAYAPYSRFKVGAAVLAESGKVYTGCNVENASFSHTCCAERIAIFNAIAEGERRLVGLAIVTDTQPPASPCGSCRQVMHEFGPDAYVLCANLGDDVVDGTMRDYLPQGFNPQVVLAAIRKGQAAE